MSSNIDYFLALEDHLPSIAKLATKLWDDTDYDENLEEFSEILDKHEVNGLFVAIADSRVVAFAHISLKYEYVEGCDSSPVGYLEAVYVNENYRGEGVAKRLLELRIEWAKEKGCSEIGSDCDLTNIDGQQYHIRSGFEEVNRVVCYRKKIITDQNSL